jgi:hypothetical protein
VLFTSVTQPQLTTQTGQVASLGKSAFGSLSDLQAFTGGSSAEVAAANGAGSSAATASDLAAPTTVTKSSRPDLVGGGYRYTLKGAIPAVSAELPVYHQLARSGILGNLSLGSVAGLPSSIFTGAQAQTVSFRKGDYIVTVDGEQGTVSIYTALSGTVSTSAIAKPSNAELIATAQRFLEAYGVDLSSYAAPQVTPSYSGILRETGAAVGVATDGSASIVAPDYAYSDSVIFPRLFQGKPVYLYGGQADGITVTLDRTSGNKVSSVYGIGLYRYESSLYAAEQSLDTIKKQAEQGGVGNYYYYEGGTGEATLGAAAEAFMLYSKYDKGVTQTYLVPVYAFAFTDSQYTNSTQHVLVPLIKDLITNQVYPLGDTIMGAPEPATTKP